MNTHEFGSNLQHFRQQYSFNFSNKPLVNTITMPPPRRLGHQINEKRHGHQSILSEEQTENTRALTLKEDKLRAQKHWENVKARRQTKLETQTSYIAEHLEGMQTRLAEAHTQNLLKTNEERQQNTVRMMRR